MGGMKGKAGVLDSEIKLRIAQYHGLLASQAAADFLSALVAIDLYIAIFLRRFGDVF